MKEYTVFLTTGQSFKIKGYIRHTTSDKVEIWHDEYMCNELRAIIPSSATVVETESITENQLISVENQLPEIDEDKLLLVLTNGKNPEIARYTKWGFHYGTRNTQDILPDVTHWKHLNHPDSI